MSTISSMNCVYAGNLTFKKKFGRSKSRMSEEIAMRKERCLSDIF